MLRKILSDSFYYAVAPQLPRLAGFFLLPILTQHLTSEDYGIYGIATAYVAGLSGIKELGFSQVLVNTFYRSQMDSNRWKLVWRQLLGVLQLWAFIYGIILGLIIWVSLSETVGGNIWELILLIVVPAVLFENTILFGSRFLQMAQRPVPIAVNSVISGITVMVVNYILVVYFGMHYMAFFWGMLAASFVSFIFFIYPVYFQLKFYPIFNIKKRRIFPHLRVALPTIPHNYSSYLLNTSDRIILDVFKAPLKSVGQYNFAYIFGNYIEVIGNAIGMAVSPFYLSLYAKREQEAELKCRDLTFFLQSIFLIGGIVLSIWCKEILAILSSNKELAECYPYAIIIIMGYTYRPMYWGVVNKLGFEEKTQHLWKISLVGGLVNVILNIIFIPFWGVYATVFSTFIGLMYIGFAGYFLGVYKKMESVNYHPWQWLSLIVFATVAVFLIKDVGIVFKLIVTMSILVFGTVIFFKNRSLLS